MCSENTIANPRKLAKTAELDFLSWQERNIGKPKQRSFASQSTTQYFRSSCSQGRIQRVDFNSLDRQDTSYQEKKKLKNNKKTNNLPEIQYCYPMIVALNFNTVTEIYVIRIEC